MTVISRRFNLGCRILALLAGLLPAYYSAFAYVVAPSGAVFYNRNGTAIPTASLRFTDGGWRRGRDQGYAFALQQNTSYFYLWINTNNGKPIGSNLACDGNLVNEDGAPVPVGTILSYTLADLAGNQWPGMVCIETVNAMENAVTLAPGATHRMTAVIDPSGLR